jgi:hypothetical protein
MRGKLQYILRFPPLKIRGKDEYILIFPGGKISMFPGGIYRFISVTVCKDGQISKVFWTGSMIGA